MSYEKPRASVKKSESFDTVSRRRFLVGAGGLGMAMAGLEVASILKENKNSPEAKRSPEQNTEKFGTHFTNEIIGYLKFYGELKLDEVMFVDEEGLPLGEPVKLEPIDGISPGEKEEATGILIGDINQAWLDAWRAKKCQEFPGAQCDLGNSLPRQMNLLFLARELANAEYLKDEDIQGETYVDVVKHFAHKQVVGHEDFSRYEYLRDHVGKSMEKVPEAIREELQFLIPGLAAQESKYINDAKSSVGAMGIMQFMPSTWSGELGYEREDILRFDHQVTGAGEFFERAYQFVRDHDNGALDVICEKIFDNNREMFRRYFLAPVLVNSYNSGPGRLVAAVKEFARVYPTREALLEIVGDGYEGGFGYDVYWAMTKFASTVVGKDNEGNDRRRIPGYGRDSSQYVLRSYSLALLLSMDNQVEFTKEAAQMVLPGALRINE
ncbi:MAG: lytic transglycosylase domain-containing protein [Candidatus Moranbacteria bacterium]|nr:lytic transglycosylase domain-containing protein [Candidatus Moranbacteria bacterium]